MLALTTPQPYHIIDCQSSEEWAELRKEGIGASSLGMLMGISHYKKNTPQTLYDDIMGFSAPMEQTYAMELGHLMEPVITELFCRRTGAIMLEESAKDFLVVDNEKPWRRVSPDRFFWPEGTPASEQTIENATILEIKYICRHDDVKRYKVINITAENFVELYPEYYAQVQYQMGVCRKKEVWVALIDKGTPDQNFVYLQIPFSEAYFNECMKLVDGFWLNYIVPCIRPTEIRNEEDAVKVYNRNIPESTIMADDQALALLRRHTEIAVLSKQLEDEDTVIKTTLCETMGFNERLVNSEGKLMASWKTQAGRNTFDSKSLAKDDPETYRKYLKTGKESRVLRFICTEADFA